ncbi:hypothetical protein HanRHA438_Chr14g0668151 [Helianthus annuus]|uniref:Uncharacterized protein n=1 Tax=Helianthus annuus TaxID=4232 RepID=A0A9K3EAW6_HELAN|nr:hypothetical protein HanXRQr2_Chr14g0657201 [Helianthus annuus]KAJ0465176.1 hypothetical protein HanHA300_Chr14g0535441 [Helianthus annuus]KAJ0469920.1 hypothetical protein HanIR_Chr14g0713141 [Helianthus annuus]KAJ0486769.1 hypothetical protein HanHA89_Chr14g0583241 [Helianthus annuus]KAJ0660902.1 hypothetical protein HanOQP8_Chr14g0542811 [Helianthus annuus]
MHLNSTIHTFLYLVLKLKYMCLVFIICMNLNSTPYNYFLAINFRLSLSICYYYYYYYYYCYYYYYYYYFLFFPFGHFLVIDRGEDGKKRPRHFSLSDRINAVRWNPSNQDEVPYYFFCLSIYPSTKAQVTFYSIIIMFGHCEGHFLCCV